MRELLQHPTRAQYGLEAGQAVGLPSGTIHPILSRLERAGIVESFWEAADEHAEANPPRPRRRYYRFAADGAETARQALAAAYKGGQTSARLTGNPVTDS